MYCLSHHFICTPQTKVRDFRRPRVAWPSCVSGPSLSSGLLHRSSDGAATPTNRLARRARSTGLGKALVI